MSHKATVWALDQRSIKGTTKIVLWHLCDRYNPEHGCFPSQELLAYDCQVSRSGLNNHLAHLERCGLMRRERRIDPISKRQMSTRYILGFEDGFTPVVSAAATRSPADIGSAEEKPCPNSGHGSGHLLDTGRPAFWTRPRVQNLDTALESQCVASHCLR